MILFLLVSCLLHKASLIGVVDFIEGENCAIELGDGTVVSISSGLCKSLKEGDQVQFYMRKKKVINEKRTTR